jgi:predicted helicase
MLNHREQLQAIRTFPQLIKYLHDELDWPISQDKFEDITFPYTPAELGIDVKVAPKIQEIRRLRPLSVHQPWGIFFVKFEPKRLPVIVMRRILNAVAIKNRASAVNADKITWASDDLLFISNYGEEENRQITFAHFTQNQIKKDLPTLNVLGWDNRDTALHLDHVSENLSTYLSWPADEKDVEAWRNSWRSAFSVAHREGIDTSKKLSIKLAGLARNIRDRINSVLEYETENGPITKLMNAFKEALVHDLDNDGFADMYAQTIAYGLLSARIANPSGKTADDFASSMPVTNPFLKELMETFIDVGGRDSKKGNSIRLDFDELGVSEVVELLDAANMEAVVQDFGDKNPLEDPVTHFYEQFFADYDNAERFKRGVFYTPRPVVSFIVRSVDELLRSEFGLEYGLADTTTWGEMLGRIDGLVIPEGATSDQAFVQILDPATGTGTFLVEVIHSIHKTMIEKWKGEGRSAKEAETLWNQYVPRDLLPRLHGYELMMAPYAIAHMKIGLKLYETGYEFESDERARVYLTNSLERAHDFSGTLAFAIPALAHEAEAVNRIKQEQYFTVVIGNPPYSIASANLMVEAKNLVEIFRYVDGVKITEKSAIVLERTLQDDYVKFYALLTRVIQRTGVGIAGYISNNTFLENINLRGMRSCLLDVFDEIEVVDLHGDADRREVTNSGDKDENVFDIKKGVAICISHKKSTQNIKKAIVSRSDILGTRIYKSNQLAQSTLNTSDSIQLTPKPEYYRFISMDEGLETEYESGCSLPELFPRNATGIETGKDSVLIDFDYSGLNTRLQRFSDPMKTNSTVRDEFDCEKGCGRTIADLRETILTDAHYQDRFTPITFTPFDERIVFYRKDLINVHSYQVARNIIEIENISLCAMRQVVLSKPFSHVFVTRSITNNRSFYSTRGKTYMLPLMIVPDRHGLAFNLSPVPNISKNHADNLLINKDLDVSSSEMPYAVLYLTYAQLHSPEYRRRYQAQIMKDYPRVFRSTSLELESDLISLGKRLVDLHLMESDVLESPATSFVAKSNPQVEKVTYSDEIVWIDKAKATGFQGVPEDVWNFHIGGYQICEKWLKDRGPKKGKPGRILTEEDIEHYQKIIVAISETIRIMGEIDEVIEAHGGWPGAFQSN